jgi:hypothetical protein
MVTVIGLDDAVDRDGLAVLAGATALRVPRMGLDWSTHTIAN